MTNPFEPPRSDPPPRRKKHSDSFTLARSGLLPGHYVPFRLRAADTFTAFAQAPSLILAIASIGSVRAWLVSWGFDPTRLYSVLQVLLTATYILLATVILVQVVTLALRYIFLIAGILSREEARSYPLAMAWNPAPWPESWQKPLDD
ncbi:MAG: hypothetical protein AAFU85_17030 [Planctomycetota bacterium]